MSGGERARLILARVLARPANLLVLDEPTNDLDMETLELLQELVAGFAGTVILVSHDRDFLDRTVTSVIAPDGGGRWIEYAGGYSDMLAQRGGTKLDDRKATAKAAPDGRPQAGRTPTRRRPAAKKLSYKQKFALENAAEEDGGGVGLDLRAGEQARRSGLLRARSRRRSRRPSPRSTRSAQTLAAHGRGMAGTGNAARGDRRLR